MKTIEREIYIQSEKKRRKENVISKSDLLVVCLLVFTSTEFSLQRLRLAGVEGIHLHHRPNNRQILQ